MHKVSIYDLPVWVLYFIYFIINSTDLKFFYITFFGTVYVIHHIIILYFFTEDTQFLGGSQDLLS